MSESWLIEEVQYIVCGCYNMDADQFISIKSSYEMLSGHVHCECCRPYVTVCRNHLHPKVTLSLLSRDNVRFVRDVPGILSL